MQCTISYHGVPIGTADITGTRGFLNGEFEPLAAFAAVRSAVDRVNPSQLLPDPDAAHPDWFQILDAHTAFCDELELTDDSGRRLVTTEVAIVPQIEGTLWVEVSIDEEKAGVGARLPDRRRKGGGAAQPPSTE